MKYTYQMILIILVSMLLASEVSADVGNCSLFVGVNDAETHWIDYEGDIIARELSQQFLYFGNYYKNVSGWVIGQVGTEPGDPILTSWNIGYLIKHNIDFYGPRDMFVFYINGHGGIIYSQNCIRISSFIGHDYNYITDKELANYLRDNVPKKLDKLVIIDSCLSGGFIDELKSIDNIKILTSASSTSKSFYDINGIPYFSRAIYDYLVEYWKSPSPSREVPFFDLVFYLINHHDYKQYEGMKAYEAEFGDEIIITEKNKDYFNFQFYQSPSYYDIHVSIDIKPGSDPNSINLKSNGVIPVAILTTSTFDASFVEPTTVLFAGCSPTRCKMVDVDYDGDKDMLLFFNTQDLHLDSKGTEATLIAWAVDSQSIEGTDFVRIVPNE